ncbi:MAG: shikimate dehydrogenase, partial [Agitococcus sp.]|nr:shikimate dehydrogenase [Agitococcus sp.]
MTNSDRYAVIGNPIGHTRSPRIHATFAQLTGENLTYEAILSPIDGFQKVVADFFA